MIAANDNRADDTFGLCPECKSHDGYRNVGPDHWFVCVRHHRKWLYGSNILSDWRDEGEADWQRTARKLEWYQTVEPFYWPETLAASAEALAMFAEDSPGSPFDDFGGEAA